MQPWTISQHRIAVSACILLVGLAAVMADVAPGQAVVRTEVTSGDPCVNDEFTVAVSVSGNSSTVGTYAFRLTFDPAVLQFVLNSAADGGDGFGAKPGEGISNVTGTADISGSNFTSTLVNGVLFRVRFNVVNAGATAPITIGIEPFGSTPLAGTNFQSIPHRYDTAATTSLCGVVEDTPTPLPTDTPVVELPTQTPSSTPTATETAAPTATPTLATGDFDEDGIIDGLESYLLRGPLTGQTNWLLPDSDGDGLADGVEDANQNGVRDPGETNPRNADSDGDGLEDGVEVLILGTDPLDPNDPAGYVDADGDGLPAGVDPNDNNPDTDGDRYGDAYEAVMLDLDAVSDPDRMPRLGDLDGDGLVDRTDGTIASEIWLGERTLDLDETRYADVNRDGWINTLDSVLMEGFAAGRVLLLPAP